MSTVLLIDDSLFALKRHKKIMENLGCEVEEAISGREGIKKYHEKKPDIVFLDLLMPDINGVEVLKELKAKNLNSKIVIVTSDIQELTKREVLEIGAYKIIGKPLTYENVKVVIDQLAVKD